MKLKFESTDQSLFFSKNDPQDPRIGDIAVAKSDLASLNNGPVIMGYPDDEGTKLNGGRVGSALAPTEIRKQLYRLTIPQRDLIIHDVGNLSLEGSLLERHDRAKLSCSEILKSAAPLITLGGSHDYAFSDGAAFIEHCERSGLHPIIINFDAHLDVRPNDSGPNSGTPFFRLLNEYAGRFDLLQIGIQPWCNSSVHLNWIKERGAQILALEDLLHSDAFSTISQFILKTARPTSSFFLSLDVDGFSSAFAPAASQVFPIGLDPTTVLKAIYFIKASWSIKLLGVYELNPTYDVDFRTSKLAATLIHQTVF
ncbi:MAG: formimidoylglutamase [Oligoflexia bacterium]|nr:formimidoylglutamase [Oligoflexia bacterium]